MCGEGGETRARAIEGEGGGEGGGEDGGQWRAGGRGHADGQGRAGGEGARAGRGGGWWEVCEGNGWLNS